MRKQTYHFWQTDPHPFKRPFALSYVLKREDDVLMNGSLK